MSITGGFGLGTNHYGAFNRGDSTWRENLTWIHGGHEFHFGLELVHLNNDNRQHVPDGRQLQLQRATFRRRHRGFHPGAASQFSQGGGEFKDFGEIAGVFSSRTTGE